MDNDGIYAVRSKRTIDIYLSVFKPMVWNIPLATIMVGVAMIMRPKFTDIVPTAAIWLCFGGMIVFTVIGLSRLPALRRSEQQDKENLKKGLRPNGEKP